jgi:sugar phosphate isomerase/epimerase
MAQGEILCKLARNCGFVVPMNIQDALSRRGFLAMAAGSSALLRAQKRKHIPVGVLVYAVIEDWTNNLNGTTSALAHMGFEGLEITNYSGWTVSQAKEYRALMDSLNLKCFASHTEPPLFIPGDKMKAMIELNHILGTQTISCVRGLTAAATPAANNPDTAGRRGPNGGAPNAAAAGQPKKTGGPAIGYHPVKATNEADAWKELTDLLQNAAVALKREGFVLSFHNHAVEFQTRKNGVGRPIDILAQAPDLTFTTDTNVAVRAGSDVVAFIKQYPGKCNSLLLTDGPNDSDGHVPALGKGTLPWKDIFDAAEGPGGIKFYLLTHGPNVASSRLEAVNIDLKQYNLIHG